MLMPRKRTFPDGRTWWCVYDTEKNDWYPLPDRNYIYRTKWECQRDIDNYKKQTQEEN